MVEDYWSLAAAPLHSISGKNHKYSYKTVKLPSFFPPRVAVHLLTLSKQ